MKTNRLGIPIIFLICLGSVLLLSVEIQEKYVVEPIDPVEETIEYHPPELFLNEDKSVYDQDSDGYVDIFEVTVYPPDDIYHDLGYINTNINYIAGSYSEDTLDPQARITLQIDGIDYEGTLELRGQSSRLLDQKSYKIKLFDDVNAFKGMRVLNLNKHYKDNFRIRNKLAYDVLEEMDNLIGLRTRFVRLYITEGGKRSDFGLFTLVEQPNKAFLSSHGLDADGQLYKAEFFEFLRYDGVLEASSSPLYSEENFNQHLEVRENPDHDKLVYLLESINDPKNNINDVITHHFSRENILSYVAINTLLDNYDSNSRNYLLYSPAYSHIWYFVLWDLDKTMREEEKEHWSFGVSNYWGVELFNRFFRDPDNVNLLVERVEEIYASFTPDKMTSRLETYAPIIQTHMIESVDYGYFKDDILDSRHRHPDLNTLEDFWDKYYELAYLPTENRERFYRNLEKPYPYFIHFEQDETARFSWDLSFDMQGDAVTYTLLIASDAAMTDILYEETTGELSIELNTLPEGSRYYTIKATDEHGNQQLPFNQTLYDGTIYRGVEVID